MRYAKTRFWFALFALLAPAVATNGASGPIVLVEDGQPRCVVVLAAEPQKLEKLAAEALVRFLEKMSGAKVPVVTGKDRLVDGAVPILLGTAAVAAVPDLDVERALGARRDMMSCRDGFVARADGDVIALAGVRPTGSLFATYDLLERLGCRWFFPGELGEVVPRKRTVRVEPYETVQVPSFELRSMWICGYGGDGLNSDSSTEINDWMRRNRASQDYRWNAQVDQPRVDITRPQSVELIAARVMSEFSNAKAEKRWCSLRGGYWGLTDEHTRSIHGPWGRSHQTADAIYGFYNQVVKRVEQAFPDSYYGTLVGGPTILAPFTLRPHPRLVPVIAASAPCPRHPPGTGVCWQRDALLESIRNWCSVSRNVMKYDYEPGFGTDGGLPVPAVARMKVEIPAWHRAGMRGLFCQAQMSVMNTGPNLFVRAKLGWDIDADTDRLVHEYFSMLFGRASCPVHMYWDELEKMMQEAPGHQGTDEIMKLIYPIERVRPLEKLVAEAERKSYGDLARRRVRMVRFSFENLMLFLLMREAEDGARFGEAADLARRIWDLHEQIEAFDPYFYKIGDLDRNGENYAHLSLGWARHNRSRQELIDGTVGNQVALLPDKWSFQPDPDNEGMTYRWFEPDLDTTAWASIRTTRFREVQGFVDRTGNYDYGAGWYRTRIVVPAESAGRRIMMNFGGVAGHMVIWINGRFVTFKPNQGRKWREPTGPFADVDMTAFVRPGETNIITIRVVSGAGLGGIYRRMFLWTPR